MKDRCYNPKSTVYRFYGGRGIRVCDHWRDDFLAFYDDVGPRPGPGYSLDRVDTSKDYDPKNCRWATRLQQKLNQRLNGRNSTGYRGVSRDSNRYRATIGVEGLYFYLWLHATPEEAAWMYDQWAIQLHGDDAKTNFDYL